MPTPDKSDFIVISMARSGTSYLRELINCVPGYHCLGEIFRRHGDSIHELSRLLACSASEVLRKKDEDKANFWRQIRLSPRRSSNTLGAKLFYSHAASRDALWQEIYPLNIIHLIRGNALELFVSIALASKTNIWKSQEYDSRYDAESVVVPVPEFLTFKTTRAQHVSLIRERYASSHYLEVLYEDLVGPGGPERFINDAFGTHQQAVSSRLEKQRRRPLKDVIENYAEVAHFDVIER